ncbi:MAG: polysaccharide deacetylase family protein [bacterium]|nr:polysaccharide deacetylase family protein [bacterium]
MTPPEIKLNRNINSFLILGTEIDLKDFTVSDNFDKDLKDKVIVEGEVDINKEGIYEVVYKVEDSSHNETKVVSTINVQKEDTDGIPILMYHWFYDDEVTKKPNNELYLSKSNFIEQMDYLVKNNYYFPTWDELEDYIDGKINLPKKSIIITADDGDPTYYKIAVPIMNARNIPSTSFVISKNPSWKNYKNQEGVSMESHTHTLHVRSCTNNSQNGKAMCLTYDEILQDLKKSLEYVENKECMAYPFGHYNNTFVKAVKDAGIHMALTTNGGRVKK